MNGTCNTTGSYIPGFKSCTIISSANEYMNIIYLNCRERYEDIVDHHSYVFCMDSESDRANIKR